MFTSDKQAKAAQVYRVTTKRFANPGVEKVSISKSDWEHIVNYVKELEKEAKKYKKISLQRKSQLTVQRLTDNPSKKD